jgi:bifunctional non-homologous end joining protein LigD
MLAIRENDRVRLLSRNGTDWTARYPWIAESALKNRIKRFVIDGEAVVLDVDGISDFNALHSMGGEDLRNLPLHLRKTNLERLLARRPDGITIAPFERGEIGPDLFRAACGMGLEGLVSKHRDRPYRGGRQKHWLKVKNRSHPALSRVMDALRYA